MDRGYVLAAFAVMMAITMAMRILPFLIFGNGKETPPVINYLGKVLPYALMGMLVVYCLRNTEITAAPHGLPELLGTVSVVGIYLLTKKGIPAIIIGAVIYMLLVQLVF